MSLREHHQAAMALADQALLSQRSGSREAALELFKQAFERELEAVKECYKLEVPEPTFSILHRSAASLAVDCRDFRGAEKLIGKALAGDPPDEIAEELRDLLETVHLSRHLQLRGVTLESDEVQLSIAGRAVGYGLALSNAFVERVEHTSKLIYRIVERRLRRPFREYGSATKDIKDKYELFISVPRAASFAVSLKLGWPTAQMSDPEITGVSDIIDEFFACIGLLNERKDADLRERISDDAYYNNFVGLAKLLAPDGDDVNLVGFTRRNKGEETTVALTRTTREIPFAAHGNLGQRAADPIVIRGRLLFADAMPESGKIKITDRDGKHHIIRVPPGMMADIVRPLWECETVVTGYKRGRDISLETIRKAEASDYESEFFMVNIGEGVHRSWEDCRRFGFVSAGDGRKYSKQMERLRAGDKIFAYLKGAGYVGFGEVLSEPVAVVDFISPVESKSLFAVQLSNPNVLHDANDRELCEWVVGVHWRKTFGHESAHTFPGIFSNENIACRLKDSETISFLRRAFDV